MYRTPSRKAAVNSPHAWVRTLTCRAYGRISTGQPHHLLVSKSAEQRSALLCYVARQGCVGQPCLSLSLTSRCGCLVMCCYSLFICQRFTSIRRRAGRMTRPAITHARRFDRCVHFSGWSITAHVDHAGMPSMMFAKVVVVSVCLFDTWPFAPTLRAHRDPSDCSASAPSRVDFRPLRSSVSDACYRPCAIVALQAGAPATCPPTNRHAFIVLLRPFRRGSPSWLRSQRLLIKHDSPWGSGRGHAV